MIVAAAQRYNIDKIAENGVPAINDFHDYIYRQFMADLDFYVTQLRLDDTSRRRRESVHLSAKAKDRIRTHITALRECIERSDLDDSKRTALLRRIEEFESELDKNRLNIFAVTLLVMNVLAIPGGLASSYDVSVKLVTNVLQEVAKEKASEDELRQLSPTAAPALLEAPHRSDSIPAPTHRNSDLDDEIPF